MSYLPNELEFSSSSGFAGHLDVGKLALDRANSVRYVGDSKFERALVAGDKVVDH